MAAALLSTTAAADPPGVSARPGTAGDPSKRAADKRPGATPADPAAAPGAASARGKGAERRAEPPEAAQARDLKEAMQRLRDTRKERRRQRVSEIKRRWGDRLSQPAARNELRVHAWRMARLNRMRELAHNQDKEKLVAKIDELIQKERDRHDKKMDHLESKGGAE